MGPSRAQLLFGIDLRSLAALRIGLAAVVLADLLLRSFNLTAHYTADGLMPVRASGGPTLNLFALNGSVGWAVTLFVLTAVAALMLLVGYRTRLATIACYLLVASVVKHTPMLVNGGDKLMCLMLFWGIFLPMGACDSIDARQGRYRAQRNAGHIASVASAGLLLQVAIMYIFTALAKDPGLWLSQRSAIWRALSLETFASDLGRQLVAHRGLLEVASVATYLLELVGPVVAFLPVATGVGRMAAAVAFILFHLSLALCMRLGTFPYVCMVMWLAFLPAGFWNLWPKPPGQSDKPESRPADRLSAWWGRPPLRAALKVILACLIVYVVMVNIVNVAVPRGGGPMGRLPRFYQSWKMFTEPPTDQYWFVATTSSSSSGDQIDLVTGGPARWDMPDWSRYDMRWRTYYFSLRARVWLHGSKSKAIIAYARWLQRRGLDRHGPARSIQVWAMTQKGPWRARTLVYQRNESGDERLWDLKALQFKKVQDPAGGL